MSSVGYYTVFSSSARAYIIAPQSVASFCGRAADRITEKREHVIAAVTPGTFSKIIIIRTDLDTHILTALHRTCKVVGQLIAERIAHQQYAAESRICAFGIEKSGRLALLSSSTDLQPKTTAAATDVTATAINIFHAFPTVRRVV